MFASHILEANVQVSLKELIHFCKLWDSCQPRELEIAYSVRRLARLDHQLPKFEGSVPYVVRVKGTVLLW